MPYISSSKSGSVSGFLVLSHSFQNVQSCIWNRSVPQITVSVVRQTAHNMHVACIESCIHVTKNSNNALTTAGFTPCLAHAIITFSGFVTVMFLLLPKGWIRSYPSEEKACYPLAICLSFLVLNIAVLQSHQHSYRKPTELSHLHKVVVYRILLFPYCWHKLKREEVSVLNLERRYIVCFWGLNIHHSHPPPGSFPTNMSQTTTQKMHLGLLTVISSKKLHGPQCQCLLKVKKCHTQ